MTTTPIADYAMLSDRHSAALVSKDGAVDWLCLPRFDSPSVFAAMLDDDAGSWSIRPVGQYRVSRHYMDATLVLQTTFETASGALVLTDALATGGDPDPHRLGAAAPHTLLRSVTCVRGSAEVEIRFRPRPEYGLVTPLLSRVDGGIRARGGSGRIVLSSPVDLEIAREEAAATVTLGGGEVLRFALCWAALDQPEPGFRSPEKIAADLEATLTSWRAWSRAHQAYEGPYLGLVRHSGRVLQGLSYQPTGAIVAAATAALPEAAGGKRNWDYRYAWIRDASFTMDALWVAACPDEAEEFFSFMTTAAATYEPERALQIMFGVGGERDLTERELPHLRGWRDSWPVRTGNGAWRQPQIDVYGALLGAASRLADQLPWADPDERAFLAALADAAARQWSRPDHGIWEIRGDPRHYVYSKVMCWVALDRAIALADRLDAADRVPRWRRARDEIRRAVLRDGWNEEAGAFTQAFGSPDLDASVLMMPIVGFLPADDPRMLATVDAVVERLTGENGLVYRYRADDGLEGGEGAFVLCTFWLAQTLALAGRVERACEVFENAVSYVNDVGLLAEEIDPATGEHLGNFPQAFSHIGLVNAAWAIDGGLADGQILC
ncbi:glycoside hydrolase family 15 protein [Microtetraspora niveoalba]|uniref:glycoside hydrolase family 15 protein n=1 Tax=Microtetraspora niveoalba TaxID=46175 RepID=UPI0008324520|nr:glycoside hydrolase family 15 protein [Microtetraspora niveoalba]